MGVIVGGRAEGVPVGLNVSVLQAKMISRARPEINILNMFLGFIGSPYRINV